MNTRRINGQVMVAKFDPVRVRELMDEFTKAIISRPPGTWAGWVIYFLEQLDAQLPADDMDVLLLELQRALITRQKEGIW